jgi:hypothetical protein
MCGSKNYLRFTGVKFATEFALVSVILITDKAEATTNKC